MSGQKENLLVLLPEVVAEVRVPEFSFWQGIKVFGANLHHPLRTLLLTRPLTRDFFFALHVYVIARATGTSHFSPTATNHDHGAHSQRASRGHSSRRLLRATGTSHFSPTATNHDHGAHSQRASRRHSSILQRWCISNASSPFRIATNNQSLQHHRRPQADLQ